MLKGKKLSILGDSLSTYEGISNNPEIHRLLKFNKAFYQSDFPLDKTYWMQIINDLEMTLCVNNSYSGGLLCGENDANAGINRAEYLSRDDGTSPDVIIVFMGINDFGYYIPSDVFGQDYQATLQKIKERHPIAKVCCVNLPNRSPLHRTETEIYNAEIENAAKTAGDNFFIADFFCSRLNNELYKEYTLGDGLHPNEMGMDIIAEFIKEALIKNC